MIDAFAMRGNCKHVLVSMLVVCDEDMMTSDCRPIRSFIEVNKVPRETHDTPINPRMTPAFSRSYSVEW